MKWIAHRGHHQHAVENTLKAFKLAIEQGYDGIECDIRITSDDAFIVYHDDTFQRLNGIQKKIHKIPLKEAIGMTYLEDKHAYILDLHTLLSYMHEKKQKMLIEIKDKLNQKQAKLLLNILNNYSIDYVIISFHIQNIRLMSSVETMWLISKVTKKVLKKAKSHHINHLGCDVKNMTPLIFENTFNQGFFLSLWTVNIHQDSWSKYPVVFITTDAKQ